MQPAPILDTAVYHRQQAAEKALKGYLASQDDSRFQARGERLPGQALHLQDNAALPSRNKW